MINRRTTHMCGGITERYSEAFFHQRQIQLIGKVYSVG